ncbi:MAG: formylglycine-generating enzyme family protein, partial [Planctomycetota bacterium]
DGSYTYGCGTTIDQSKANYLSYNPLGLSSYPYTSPVNYYSSFGYGMNDIAGNVFELTDSCYDAGCDPDFRPVVRGGCWPFGSYYCIVSVRSPVNLVGTSSITGFRACR